MIQLEWPVFWDLLVRGSSFAIHSTPGPMCFFSMFFPRELNTVDCVMRFINRYKSLKKTQSFIISSHFFPFAFPHNQTTECGLCLDIWPPSNILGSCPEQLFFTLYSNCFVESMCFEGITRYLVHTRVNKMLLLTWMN